MSRTRLSVGPVDPKPRTPVMSPEPGSRLGPPAAVQVLVSTSLEPRPKNPGDTESQRDDSRSSQNLDRNAFQGTGLLRTHVESVPGPKGGFVTKSLRVMKTFKTSQETTVVDFPHPHPRPCSLSTLIQKPPTPLLSSLLLPKRTLRTISGTPGRR